MASASAERRWSSSSNPKERFPDLDHSQSGEFLAAYDENDEGATTSRTPSPAKANGLLRNERWRPRGDSHVAWGNGHINVSAPREHGRQKSLSDAFRTIRNRRASVSENAHEIADALKAPVSVRIIVRLSSGIGGSAGLIIVPGSLPRMVLELRLD